MRAPGPWDRLRAGPRLEAAECSRDPDSRPMQAPEPSRTPTPRAMIRLRYAAPLLATTLLAACTSTPQDDPSASMPIAAEAEAEMEPFVPPAPQPWTEAFEGGALLLANTVTIEGPPGLLEHFVLRGDDALFERETKATSEGFVQVLRPLAGTMEPAQGFLDRWNVNALVELRATENPALCDVRVVAEGDAVWRTTGGESKKGARLVFTGVIEPAVTDEPMPAVMPAEMPSSETGSSSTPR